MKNTKTALALLLLVSSAFGETFVGMTSPTNRLIVATNEVMLIHLIRGGPLKLQKDGAVFSFGGGYLATYSPAAISGPGELILTNQPVLLNFKRITSTGIQTMLMRPSTTNTVTLLAGSDIRFFRPLGASGITASVRQGQNEFTDVSALSELANEELSGPLDISVRNPSLSDLLVSYVLLQPAQSLQEQGVIQGPTGRFQVVVESSLNLTNWTVTALQEITDDQKAFYRLRIIK